MTHLFATINKYVKPIGTPVIFLTAKSGIDDRIKGLKMGADDYIVKPFQIGELLARVEALLRRYGKINNKLTFADVEVDMVSRTVSKGGKSVELTVKEFELHRDFWYYFSGCRVFTDKLCLWKCNRTGKKIAFQNFQYNRYILQSILYSDPEFFLKKETEAENILNSFSVPVAVYGVDGKYFFSNLAAQPGELDLVEADDNRISFRIYEKDERNYIFVSNDVEVKR